MDALIICIIAISIAFIRDISLTDVLQERDCLEIKRNDSLVEYTDAFMQLIDNIEKEGSGLP